MTINDILKKLLKNNFKKYILLCFSLIVTISFITSIGLVYLGSTVSNVLLSSGSSSNIAKYCYMSLFIFSIIFILYVFNLFLKLKSKEIGIFLSLGISKNSLSKILRKEVSVICGISSVIGIIISYPLSKLVWGIMTLLIKTNETILIVSVYGYFIGIGFSILIFIVLLYRINFFIKRVTILNILKSSETVEDVQSLKPYTIFIGIILIPLGIVLMDLLIRLNGIFPIIGLLSFLLTPLGIYIISLRIPFIGERKKKRNPKKYYKNILFYNLIKLKGRQYVNTIFITSVVLGISTFAFTFILSQIISVNETTKNMNADYTFTYKENSANISNEDIENLSKKYNIKIENLKEFESLTLIKDNSFFNPETNETEYEKIAADVDVISLSAYEKISNGELNLPKDGFSVVYHNLHHIPVVNEIILTNPSTKTSYPLKFESKIELNILDGLSSMLYIINDNLYGEIKNSINNNQVLNTIIFNSPDWKNEYDFAKELKNLIIENTDSSANDHKFCNHTANDFKGIPCTHEDMHVELTTDNYEISRWWKYAPSFKVLLKNDSIFTYSIYIFLFIFISVLGFLSSSIILYIKSISNLWSDKEVYLKAAYLGMKRESLIKIIKKQQRLLFIIPTLIGTLTSLIFLLIMTLSQGFDFMMSIFLYTIPLLILIYLVVLISYKLSTKHLINEALDFSKI